MGFIGCLIGIGLYDHAFVHDVDDESVDRFGDRQELGARLRSPCAGRPASEEPRLVPEVLDIQIYELHETRPAGEPRF
jgi:hypothetical protein